MYVAMQNRLNNRDWGVAAKKYVSSLMEAGRCSHYICDAILSSFFGWLSISHTYTHKHTWTHTHTHTHTHTYTHALLDTHSQTHMNTHTHSLSLTHTHTFSLSITHTQFFFKRSKKWALDGYLINWCSSRFKIQVGSIFIPIKKSC